MKLSSKASIGPSQEELENRLQTLTDHLIQKQVYIPYLSVSVESLRLQTQLENLISEKQYLQLQLENVIHNQKSSDDRHTILIHDYSKKKDRSDMQGEFLLEIAFTFVR